MWIVQEFTDDGYVDEISAVFDSESAARAYVARFKDDIECDGSGYMTREVEVSCHTVNGGTVGDVETVSESAVEPEPCAIAAGMTMDSFCPTCDHAVVAHLRSRVCSVCAVVAEVRRQLALAQSRF